MSFATSTNIRAIKKAAEEFPITMSQWTLCKVWMCQGTDAIRVRFKNDSIGMIGGIIRVDFEVKTTMEISEIEENVTLDKIVFQHKFDVISEKVFNIILE